MNLAMILDMAADGFGDRRAIGDLTYADLRRAAASIGARAERKSDAPTAIATLLPNGQHVPIALFGAAWAGLSYAPLNFRLPTEATDALLARVQPAALFDDAWTDTVASELPEGSAAYVAEPTNPAVLLFTSGTSSAPKTAVLHHDNLTSYLFNTLEFGSAGEDETALISVPPFHIAGVAAVLSSTYVGRRIVLLPRFSATAWLQLAADEAVTHAMVVPTMLARIVASLQADPSLRPPALRSLAYGGARMPAPVLEQALELLPNVDFVNAYGLTETSSTVAILGPDDHRRAFESDDPILRKRLQSCGRAVPGVEFKVSDDELWIRGGQVGGGYLGARSQVDDDGWLHTGDRGHIDDDGYIFISGRADDMIIRGGENISPTEIEDTLLRHPDIASVAVVGLPDLEWGEKLGAMIVFREGADLDLDDLRIWAKERLGSIKVPEVIIVSDDLPATPTGKILRRTVREVLAEPATGSR